MRLKSVKILAIILVVVTLLPLSKVFAASYDSLWYIYIREDPQKRNIAEFQVKYTFPDKVKAGAKFEVQVSITYLVNDKAKLGWVDFFDVSVHTRSSPTGADITVSELDSSRPRVTPGQQYSHTFTIVAPEDSGEYLVALTWKTISPTIYAYGWRVSGGELHWDTGTGEDIAKARLTVRGEASLTIHLENIKTAEIKIDGKVHMTDGGEVKVTLPIDVSYLVEVPREIEVVAGTRAVFDKWSDGDTSNPRRLTLADDVELTAIYKIRYLLVVNSEIGEPQGGEWYEAGEKAAFSVTCPVAESGFMGSLGAKIVFDHWSGDSTASSPAATITMDSPKTVTAIWKTDYTQAYITLGVIVVVILAIVSVAVVMRRRKAPIQPPPPIPVGAPAMKYCVQCGSQMPLDAIHCPRCGARQ